MTGARVGREVRYAVRSAALDATARWMASPAADWDRRPARIKDLAETAEQDPRAARTSRDGAGPPERPHPGARS